MQLYKIQNENLQNYDKNIKNEGGIGIYYSKREGTQITSSIEEATIWQQISSSSVLHYEL